MIIISIISTRLLNNYFKTDGFSTLQVLILILITGRLRQTWDYCCVNTIISVYLTFLGQYFLEYFASVCFISDKGHVK